MTAKSHSTSNKIVWEFYTNLKLLEKYYRGKAVNEGYIKNIAMMSIFMSVACVEAFINMFFRELLEDNKYSHLKDKTLPEMENNRFGLEQKIKQWPERFFSKNVYGTKPGKAFQQIKNTRNSLLHYRHTYEPIEVEQGVTWAGLTDFTIFDKLTNEYSFNARDIATNFIREILLASGCAEDRVHLNLQHWTGEMKGLDYK
jgi:hypothetical protein